MQTSGLLFSAYTTHNAAEPLGDITGGTLSDYMLFLFRATKDFLLLVLNMQ